MDLTRQPPRRPSNLGIGGIVGAARMVGKARAYNDETLGEFLYGENSWRFSASLPKSSPKRRTSMMTSP